MGRVCFIFYFLPIVVFFFVTFVANIEKKMTFTKFVASLEGVPILNSHLYMAIILLCDCMDCSLPGSSTGFSRQEYWSGLPFPSPGDPPNPGIEPRSPALQADSLPSEPPGKPPIIGRS